MIDSGKGGIAFGKSITENIDYLEPTLIIDEAGFPYGDKEFLWLKERVNYLVDKAQDNLILIACNTLSSIIFHYNMAFKKKVVDVITPTIYFFNQKDFKNVIILASKNTIQMDIYSKLLDIDVTYVDATELIYNIEKELDLNDSINKMIEGININGDVILLGCTHLIKVKENIRKKTNKLVVSQDEIFINFFKIN